MFGLLNNTQQQAYGVQQTTHNNHKEPTKINNSNSNNNDNNITKKISNISSLSSNNNSTNKQQKTTNKHHQRPRSTSSLSDSVRESKIFTSLSSMHAGLKTPTNLIEKFLKTELLNSYENLKNYKNFQHSTNNQATTNINLNKHFTNQRNSYTEGLLNNFNCLQGSYRSNSDGEFYEAINVVNTRATTTTSRTTIATATKVPHTNAAEMTIKCSKNLLAEPPQVQAPATLQNYQKLPDYVQHGYIATPEVVQLPSSGASSGEFNTDLNSSQAAPAVPPPQTTPTSSSSNSFYKRLSFGGNRSSKHLDINAAQSQANESASDNSSSSITTTTTTNSLTSTTTAKSNDLHRSSSASSSGDCQKTARERKCKSFNPQDLMPTINQSSGNVTALTPERLQRRKLMQMISNYEQQNKQLQRELAKEKRRRNEELSRVVKSLLCFESKLKTDMKAVNQRLAEKDNEICRLVRQNRALRKQLLAVKQQEKDKICDEGVVVGDVDGDGDGEADDINSDNDAKNNAKAKEQTDLMEDCLVLEALQCNNCRKQFYDIELNSSCTQTMLVKDGGRKNAEHGSSSDDTVSSSFCGARRSVRYTSKRTSGTFRDYMRSRAMNIDDPALEQNSEENTSTISRDDSQTSYEKLNVYSRTIERMHGVKCENERLSSSEQSGASLKGSRPSSRCSSKSSDKSVTAAMAAMEEDDGIFSPTQDDDFEEETNSIPTAASNRALKIISRRATEFSEASPKQIYETSTDDWYASASDQEEIVGGGGGKTSYSQAAVNPVLECVNQILLQQSMEDTVVLREKVSKTPQKRPQNLPLPTATNLPRRSSLSGRRNSRNENGSSPNSPRTGTLTRKRVHFSTKNSMVHVPRNDEIDDEDDEDNEDKGFQMKPISSPQFHAMPGFSTPLIVSPTSNVIATDVTVETFNYESIYSNEYEPVGSERNSSNLYVDMESAMKPSKKPPALPPKPANLIKFKKSLHQLDEVPDEQQDCDANTSTAASEPDYCSISEVNVGITNVQIVAVVHKPPESETADDNDDEPVSEMDLEVSTVASDDTCGAISQKTDEIEEIFADIPKLPNVAAIIAPKKQIKQHQQHLKQQKPNNTDYLIMAPKVETSNAKTQNARRLALNLNAELLSTPLKSAKLENSAFSLQLPIGHSTNNTQPQQHQQQYKRKHMPNILAEINQRLSLPNTPTTPTATAASPFVGRAEISASNNSLQQQFDEVVNSDINMANDSPLQAEFDWYNLDAEYGRASISTTNGVGGSVLNQPDLLQINDHLHGNGKLAEIQEDHESLTATADEYNLDEEFSLSSDQQPADVLSQPESQNSEESKDNVQADANINALCEAANFPLYNENSPAPAPAPAKAKKMKKNLANFEKFIEGSGLSTKPLPSKRKIYFAGPYV